MTCYFDFGAPGFEISGVDNSDDYYIERAYESLDEWKRLCRTQRIKSKSSALESPSKALLLSGDDFLDSALLYELFCFHITKEAQSVISKRVFRKKDTKVSESLSLKKILLKMEDFGLNEAVLEKVAESLHGIGDISEDLFGHEPDKIVLLWDRGGFVKFPQKSSWVLTRENWTIFRIKNILSGCSGSSLGALDVIIPLCKILEFSTKISMSEDIEGRLRRDRFDLNFAENLFLDSYFKIVENRKLPIIEVSFSELTDLSLYVKEEPIEHRSELLKEQVAHQDQLYIRSRQSSRGVAKGQILDVAPECSGHCLLPTQALSQFLNYLSSKAV